MEFGYDDLRALPAVTRTAFVECAGNGRSSYTTQQGETVSGTAWTLGAIGVARWRGVRLADVLRRAGLAHDAVDVQPRGLDAEYVSGGESLGRVRRPLPLAKALDDILLAYEMNGEWLPYDHGYPVRVLVPSWVGIASIKWVGDMEVSAEPLYSPWNTTFYRLFGPAYPQGGSPPLTRQATKSGFELADGAMFTAGRPHVLHGRSWSGAGAVARVDISRRPRDELTPCPPAGPAPRRYLDPLVPRLAPGGTRRHPAAGPGHRHRRPHSAGHRRAQHTGLPVRRGGTASGERGVTTRSPAF